MNIVKKAGLIILVIAGINTAISGSLLYVPLAFTGIWIFLIGGLSE
jgi:hypothetical protein